MTDHPRYFVTLSATCPAPLLHEVVDHLSAGMPALADALPGVEGLSLSFTREDADQMTAQTIALPVAPPGPVSTDAPAGQHASEVQG